MGTYTNHPLAITTNNAERMRIDTSGQLLVGTTSGYDSNATGAITLNANAADGTVNFKKGIVFSSDGGSVQPVWAHAGITSTGSSGFNGSLVFGTDGTGTQSSTITERMRIDSSGYVRVNNTTGIDGQFSSVAGSYYAGAFANTDATYPVTYNWNRATSGNNLFMTFYTEAVASSRGTIDYNRAGNAVRYNTTSDQRLKENITDASSALPKVNSISIKSFDWKETGNHVDFGVIAQELITVAPECVTEGVDNEDGSIKSPWQVDTAALVPVLVKAIQEQQAIINDLKARIETLESK